MKYITTSKVKGDILQMVRLYTAHITNEKIILQYVHIRQRTKKNSRSQDLPSARSLEPGLQEQAKEPGKLIQLT